VIDRVMVEIQAVIAVKKWLEGHDRPRTQMPTVTYQDITVVVGVDAKTFPQLQASWPTWAKYRAEMWAMPWLVFHDQLNRDQVVDFVHSIGVPQFQVVPWPPQLAPYDVYASQRERMLTGHVWVPAEHVRTSWHMKIDTDVVATRHDNWFQPEWFEDHPQHGQMNCYVAPRWGYTKGVGFLEALDDWGDKIADLCHRPNPRLNIPQQPGQLRVGHERMCSWLSYYNVEFTKLCTSLLESSKSKWRLPVPSQDTFMWYVGARLGLHHNIVNMKRLGWDNISRLDALRQRVAEILAKDS
jgi:hypothetical protein